MEEEVPLVVRLSQDHNFEMDEREYLLQSDTCFTETTTKRWKILFFNYFKLCGYFVFIIKFFSLD